MNYRHHKGTLALFVLALVLTAILIWDRGNVSTGEADLRAENFVEAWRPDDVSRVDLTLGDRSVSLVHERDAEGQLNWELKQNDEALDGDEQALAEYVSNLELGLFVRELDDVDRATLGFDAPRATIVIHMGQLRYTLRVGKEAPTPAGAGYLEVEGGSRGRVAYVVTGATIEELLVDIPDLLAKRLAMLYSPSVAKYAIASSAGTLVLERGGWGGSTAGAFLVKAEGQPDVRANHNEVDKLLLAVNDVEVKAFVPMPAAALDHAVSLALTPASEGQPVVRLEVGEAEACGEGRVLALRREPDPVAGCVDESVLERLRVTPEQLRDRGVLGTREGDIMELRLESGKTVVDLARKGEGWHMRKPKEGPAAAEPMDLLLKRMADARGNLVSDPDRAALGLDPPLGEVRILGLPERVGAEAGAERVEEFSVGSAIDGTVHIQRKDDGAVIAIDADTGGLFLPHPTLLRSTKIFEEDRKYIRGVVTSCRGRVQELARDMSASWAFVTPKDAEADVDGALVNDLIDGLRTLEAVRWIAEKPEERHGLDKPWCTVTLKLEEPDEADPTGETKTKRDLTVLLGNESQGGYFAKTATEDAVFVAPRALGNASDQWFLSRTALNARLGDVESIGLTGQDGRKLELKRQGEAWKVDGGADTLGVTVAAALEGLSADVALSRGAPAASAGFDDPVLTIVLRRRQGDPVTFKVGRAETWRNSLVYSVRRSDLDVTYLVARSRVQPLVDAL